MLPILRSRFDELERQRRALLEELGSHSPAQLAFRPSDRSWSMADVVQHLILVEEGMLQFLTKKPPRPDNRSPAERLQYAMFKLLVQFPLRVKVPVPSVIPTVQATLEELSPRWDSVRARYEEYLSNVTEPQLSMLVFKHAFAGPVTILETLDVMRLHILHHGHQLRRIRAANHFPAMEVAAAPAGARA
ncbi:MAG TPA: DinB family protein [Gemmatimonadaceae bacterium]|jgi:uncharacterized damage-inducible protein DinB